MEMKIIFTIDKRTNKGKEIIRKIRENGGFFWYHSVIEAFNNVAREHFKLTQEEVEEIYFDEVE